MAWHRAAETVRCLAVCGFPWSHGGSAPAADGAVILPLRASSRSLSLVDNHHRLALWGLLGGKENHNKSEPRCAIARARIRYSLTRLDTARHSDRR